MFGILMESGKNISRARLNEGEGSGGLSKKERRRNRQNKRVVGDFVVDKSVEAQESTAKSLADLNKLLKQNGATKQENPASAPKINSDVSSPPAPEELVLTDEAIKNISNDLANLEPRGPFIGGGESQKEKETEVQQQTSGTLFNLLKSGDTRILKKEDGGYKKLKVIKGEILRTLNAEGYDKEAIESFIQNAIHPIFSDIHKQNKLRDTADAADRENIKGEIIKLSSKISTVTSNFIQEQDAIMTHKGVVKNKEDNDPVKKYVAANEDSISTPKVSDSIELDAAMNPEKSNSAENIVSPTTPEVDLLLNNLSLDISSYREKLGYGEGKVLKNSARKRGLLAANQMLLMRGKLEKVVENARLNNEDLEDNTIIGSVVESIEKQRDIAEGAVRINRSDLDLVVSRPTQEENKTDSMESTISFLSISIPKVAFSNNDTHEIKQFVTSLKKKLMEEGIPEKELMDILLNMEDSGFGKLYINQDWNRIKYKLARLRRVQMLSNQELIHTKTEATHPGKSERSTHRNETPASVLKIFDDPKEFINIPTPESKVDAKSPELEPKSRSAKETHKSSAGIENIETSTEEKKENSEQFGNNGSLFDMNIPRPGHLDEQGEAVEDVTARIAAVSFKDGIDVALLRQKTDTWNQEKKNALSVIKSVLVYVPDTGLTKEQVSKIQEASKVLESDTPQKSPLNNGAAERILTSIEGAENVNSLNSENGPDFEKDKKGRKKWFLGLGLAAFAALVSSSTEDTSIKVGKASVPEVMTEGPDSLKSPTIKSPTIKSTSGSENVIVTPSGDAYTTTPETPSMPVSATVDNSPESPVGTPSTEAGTAEVESESTEVIEDKSPKVAESVYGESLDVEDAKTKVVEYIFEGQKDSSGRIIDTVSEAAFELWKNDKSLIKKSSSSSEFLSAMWSTISSLEKNATAHAEVTKAMGIESGDIHKVFEGNSNKINLQPFLELVNKKL